MTTIHFINVFFNNLIGGLKLALFLPITRQQFYFSQAQLLALLLLGLSLDVTGDRLNVTPPIEFNYYGVSYLLSLYFASLASLYLISLLHKNKQLFSQLIILNYASYPIIFLLSLLVSHSGILYTEPEVTSVILGLLLVWSLVILYRILRLLTECSPWLMLSSVALYLCINLSAYLSLPEQPLWYGDLSAAEDASIYAVNTENTYYRQIPLLQDALRFVSKGNADKQEYYFLGFSPDARQDVFLKESLAVQDIVDRRLHTRERSLLLVNHAETYHEQPLANAHNLHAALTDFGQKMDKDDILLLFLTSHGNETHELSVNFANMQFNYLPASKLASMLDNSGIKWRVIVVSACYAGGFIDPLKNPNSLIITAAAQDKQSAGCSHDSDATWFTDAFFKQAFTQTSSFTAAFEMAKPLIRHREQQAGLEYSNPQIFIGKKIHTKLNLEIKH